MATITEDFVSFETAKLLKEKGFDIPCNCYGGYNGVNLTYRLCITDKYTNWNKHTDKTIISCPTLQMTMKWLREMHNIFIEINVSIDLNGNYHYSYSILNKECKYVRKGYTDFDWDYKQSCEAAIKYCLENLI